MKRRSLGIVVASFALLTACSGAAEEAEDVETAAGEATIVEPGAVLIGTVGTEEDPEAFEIALTTEDGEPVTTLRAGDYTIEVSDPSAMHNFHLVGGSVDEATSVPDKEDATFEITVEEGEYTYKCDPHPPMTGTFEVVA